jgi:WD40 repeat protein
MAFSPNGRWLASGDAGGSVIVWDVAERRVRSKTQAHPDTVTSLAWRDDELWTASVEGTLKRWRNEAAALALIDSSHEGRAIRFLHLLADGWVASVNSQEVLIERPLPIGRLRLDLDRHVERIEVSRDGRYVAATSSSEVVVIDQARRAIASLPVVSSGLGYVGFTSQNSLVISKSDGLYTASLSALELIPFEPRPSE